MPPTSRPVRVAVVNDYEIVVRGLAAMVESYSERIVVVELDVREPVVSDVDVVLYDTFGQAQADRVEIADLVTDGSPRLVVYSWNVDEDLVDRALAKGASGYASKSLGTAELVDLIERVHAGEIVRPDADAAVGDDQVGSWPGDRLGLSAREAEVLALITQGRTNEEIAQQAYLSINTVKTYIRSAYRKIGVTRRTDAILWGVEHGFTPDRGRIVKGI